MHRGSLIGILLITILILGGSQTGEANWFTNLFSSSKAQEAHETVFNENNPQQHKNSWTHELIAAAAGWEAMRAYERHQAKQTGQPVNHSLIKSALAGFAAAAIDRLIETKGLDWVDAQRAKTGAAQQAERLANEKYGLNSMPASGASGSNPETSDTTPSGEYR
ncbi:uncharacterized protein LOC129602729 [Paramacrobiotus metropolitanus]|uniref:uncharacterized protein LOC129602729 n=1 Tax=Paramacrobiotus metropolitanus TaxID=2943436 RepID=UPI0024460FD4|nr:uncharacterized protein LOC129602729 [Paramacrobiotus metropolitanus]